MVTEDERLNLETALKIRKALEGRTLNAESVGQGYAIALETVWEHPSLSVASTYVRAATILCLASPDGPTSQEMLELIDDRPS